MTVRPVTRERLGDLTWVLFMVAVLVLGLTVPVVVLRYFDVSSSVSIPVGVVVALVLWGLLSSYLSKDPHASDAARSKRTWAENRQDRRSRRLD